MMKSRIICILLLLVGVSGIYAQSLTVTGKVVDNEGLEVIGGNVTVKGKQNTGTITDINGKYTITVSDPQKDVLVFSFIGLENMEVPVKGRKQIDVTMKAASVLLDEVVAIGYATVLLRKVFLITAFSCRPFLPRRLVQVIFQLSGTARMAQFTERFRLDLTDTLSCNIKLFTNLFEGSRTAIIKSETETQNLLLTVGQRA